MRADQSDQQFLARMKRLGDVTVQDLCDAFGVTATAVRQRLARLMATGFVERERVPAERGRPYHAYRVTSAGRRQLGDDYSELARLLWREIQEIEEPEVRDRLMARLRGALVKRYGGAQSEPSLGGRFRQLLAALDEQGLSVDLAQRQQGDELLPVLREHNCPYQDLAAEDASICELEQSVFEEVLGVPVKLTQCARSGASYCEFAPVMST